MSHIVIHDDHAGITQYREFDDVQAAAEYLENLHNDDGIEDARLYALDPVEFAVKSYVRVEIPDAGEVAGSADDAGNGSRWGSRDRTEPALQEMAHGEEEEWAGAAEAEAPAEVDEESVEYVDASSADYLPPPELGPEPEDEPVGGEVRRGLFGR